MAWVTAAGDAFFYGDSLQEPPLSQRTGLVSQLPKRFLARGSWALAPKHTNPRHITHSINHVVLCGIAHIYAQERWCSNYSPCIHWGFLMRFESLYFQSALGN